MALHWMSDSDAKEILEWMLAYVGGKFPKCISI